MTSQSSAESAPIAPKTTESAPGPMQVLRERVRRGDLGQLPVVLTLILIAVFFEVTSGGLFFLPRNLSNLILQIATIGMLALGSVLVLLIAEIDLSLGVVSYVCGTVMVVLSVQHGATPVLAILGALVVGAIIGLLNGIFVAVLRVPSFIVTLAALIGYSGLVLHILLPNTTIRLIDPVLTGIAANYLMFPWDVLLPVPLIAIYVLLELWNRIRRQRAGLSQAPLWELAVRTGTVVVVSVLALIVFETYRGVPYSALILLGTLLLFWLIMRFTGFGRHVYAVGGNAEAARRAGINVVGIRIVVFTLASTLAALGGILASSRAISGTAQIDQSLLLDAIAVAVIGGVSLFGGRGSVWAVVLGSLVIGSLENGLNLLGQGQDIKLMVEGAVLIIAVTADAISRRRNVSGVR
ncbi:MAG TPA: inner-membrane translocator [Ktedonobacterales bacterium]|nr:inner-membrane translocator [Ktedonobacterales bacterium]